MAWQTIEPVEDYPTEEFTAVLENIYIKTVGQSEIPTLTLAFENKDAPEYPKEISVFGIDKLNEETAEGRLKTKTFFDLGKLVKSFREFGVNIQIDLEGDQAKTEPDITGSTVTMTPEVRKFVGDDGESRGVRSWRVTKIVQTEQNATPLASSQPMSKGIDDDLRVKWEEFFFEHLTTPLTAGEIIRILAKTITDPKLRIALNKIRTQVLKDAVETGVLVMPEPGKYQVVE